MSKVCMFCGGDERQCDYSVRTAHCSQMQAPVPVQKPPGKPRTRSGTGLDAHLRFMLSVYWPARNEYACVLRRQGLKLKEVGARIGVSRERARQMVWQYEHGPGDAWAWAQGYKQGQIHDGEAPVHPTIKRRRRRIPRPAPV